MELLQLSKPITEVKKGFIALHKKAGKFLIYDVQKIYHRESDGSYFLHLKVHNKPWLEYTTSLKTEEDLNQFFFLGMEDFADLEEKYLNLFLADIPLDKKHVTIITAENIAEAYRELKEQIKQFDKNLFNWQESLRNERKIENANSL